jgi:hypothetical protein
LPRVAAGGLAPPHLKKDRPPAMEAGGNGWLGAICDDAAGDGSGVQKTGLLQICKAFAVALFQHMYS